MADRQSLPTDLQRLRSELMRRAAQAAGEAAGADGVIAAIWEEIEDCFSRLAQQTRRIQVQKREVPPIVNNIDRRYRRP